MATSKKIYTYLEAKTKVIADFDLEDLDNPDNFVTDQEVLGYFNEAIDEAEAEIHNMFQMYFKTKYVLNIIKHNDVRSLTASNDGGDLLLTSTAHNLAIDNRITVSATTLPGNISADTYYWIIEVIDDDNYKISSTRRGASVAFSSAGLDVLATYEGQRYALPIDIYANKILFIQYANNQKRYKIDKTKNEEVEYLDNSVTTTDFYFYDIENTDPAIGAELILHRPSTESGAFVTIWYLRGANRLESDTDVIDIPEFINFIFAFVKYKICLKERTNMLLGHYINDLEKQRSLMKQTLDIMIPDEEETIDPDFSFYDDFGSDYGTWPRGYK